MSEGGGGAGRGDRGSRCRDGTLANGLLHDALPFHLVHHIFYRETAKGDGGVGGERRMRQNDKWINRGGKRRKTRWKEERARGRSLDEDEGAGKREEKHFRGVFSRSIQQHSHQHGKQLVLHSIRTFPQTANSLHSPCQRSTTLSMKGKREELCGKRGLKKKKGGGGEGGGGAGVEAENKSKIGCFNA